MKKGTDVAPQAKICRCYPSWITLTYLIYHIFNKLTTSASYLLGKIDSTKYLNK